MLYLKRQVFVAKFDILLTHSPKCELKIHEEKHDDIEKVHLIHLQIFSMRVAKLYKDNTEQITNIHYRFES